MGGTEIEAAWGIQMEHNRWKGRSCHVIWIWIWLNMCSKLSGRRKML